MDVRGIRVEIDSNRLFGSKAEAEAASAEGAPVGPRRALRRVVVSGNLSDDELRILERTARHCPVGRLFEGGPLRFDEVVVRENDPDRARPDQKEEHS